MQGRIGFEDRAGGGTTFLFELPVLSRAEGGGRRACACWSASRTALPPNTWRWCWRRAATASTRRRTPAAVGELLARWKYGAWLLARRLSGVDTLALLEELRRGCEGTRVIMLAGLTSDEAGVTEPQRHGIADWLSKADSRARILEVVDHATGRVAS